MIFCPVEKEYLNLIRITYNEAKDDINTINLIDEDTQYKWWQKIQETNSNYVLLAKVENQYIGFVCIKNIDWVNRSCDLTYYIFKDFRGQSLGKNIVINVVEFIFDTLNLNSIMIQIIEDNYKSIKCAINAGFRHVGILRQRVFKNGTWLNILILDRIKDDGKNNN